MRTIPVPCRGEVVRQSYWSSRQPSTDAYHTLSWSGCTAILLVQPATNKRGTPYLVVERLYGNPIGPDGNQGQMRIIPCRGAVVRRSYWSSRQPMRKALPTLSWSGCTAILLVQPAIEKRGAPYLVVKRLYGDPIGPVATVRAARAFYKAGGDVKAAIHQALDTKVHT
jgi:hypothetical protein